MSHGMLASISQSKLLRKWLGRPYVALHIWIWKHLPASLTSWRLVWSYGHHLHNLILLRATRNQYVGTYFFRNRAELELLVRLLAQKRQDSTIDLAVLACSKGAEVYSINYAIRSTRTDLKVRIRASDISKEVLDFAEAGVYYDRLEPLNQGSLAPLGEVAAGTYKDQPSSIFERVSAEEMAAMFDREGDQIMVKPRFREGISWHVGNAADPGLVRTLGLHDIVVANRFLCHMYSDAAERCLRNLARLVKPSGYLFVSGVDLNVRSRVARDLGWRPVTELIKQIHEGDPSLRRDWPLQYWGLEPFDQGRLDWPIRYASVFQMPGRQ
jgi:chemotaxis methyl-accepting protein methylase